MNNSNCVCSGCNKPFLILENFGINLKTNKYYKTCIKCRDKNKIRNEQDKEKIKEYSRNRYKLTKDKRIAQVMLWKKNNEAYLKEVLTCECGGVHQRSLSNQHFKSKMHVKHIEMSKRPGFKFLDNDEDAISMARLKYIQEFIQCSNFTAKWVGYVNPNDEKFFETFNKMSSYNPEEYLVVEYHAFEFEEGGITVVRWRMRKKEFS